MKKLLSLILLILIGCSEPEPTNIKLLKYIDKIYYDLENKPFSGKVFRTYSDNSGDIWIEGEIKGGVPTTYQEPVQSSQINIRNNKVYLINSQSLFSGHVISIIKDKIIEEGNFKDGMIDGYLIGYYTSGQVEYKSFYQNGVEFSTNRFFEDGQVEIESFINDDGYNLVKNYNQYGNLVSEFSEFEGRKDGPYKSYHSNGEIQLEGEYDYHLKDGKWTSYYKDGMIEEEKDYVLGNISGSVNKYNSIGQLVSKETFEMNETNGPFIRYYDNGQLYQRGTFKNYYERTGLFEEFYEDGTLKVKKTIINNLETDFEFYYSDGSLERKGVNSSNYIEFERNRLLGNFEISYKNNKPYNGTQIVELGYSGREVFYVNIFKDGKLISKEFKKFNEDNVIINGFYKDDKKHGLWKYYNDDGTLDSTETYENGKLNGPYIEYYDGKIVEQGIYENDRLVSDKKL